MTSGYMLLLREYAKKFKELEEELQKISSVAERQPPHLKSPWEFLAELEERYTKDIRESSDEVHAFFEKVEDMERLKQKLDIDN
jgi:hypothetical protein